jgi:sugar phosphate isomerase/epimerase
MRILLASLALASPTARAASDHLGLELWSLRNQLKVDVPAGLAIAASDGFTVVETAGTYGLAAGDFAAQLHAHGLRPVSAHLGFAELEGNLEGSIAQARALGVDYVVVAWIPHHPAHFGVADARAAAAKFNAWGAALKAHGIKFGYHTHGYEFVPEAGGETPFDVLMSSTQPDLVCLEMDVFWVAHAGVDPVALFQRYPGRWQMLHLKDLRKGAKRDATGAAPATDDVPVGQGEVDWPAVLAAARLAGVKYYFIEDESVSPLQNVPVSLRYLARFHL